MNTLAIFISKTDKGSVQELQDEYVSRIKKLLSFEVVEIDTKKWRNLPPEELKKKEAEAVIQILTPKDYIILLDERGKQFTSMEFSQKISERLNDSSKRLVFIVGGAFGFHFLLYKKSNEMLSFSKFTLTHQLIRIFFLEQFYRSLTIIKGIPYHHE